MLEFIGVVGKIIIIDCIQPQQPEIIVIQYVILVIFHICDISVNDVAKIAESKLKCVYILLLQAFFVAIVIDEDG